MAPATELTGRPAEDPAGSFSFLRPVFTEPQARRVRVNTGVPLDRG